MNLFTLQYAPTVVLPTSFTLYRVQRLRCRPGSIKAGALRLPPLGLCAGRFDLLTLPVGYFAETPETAAYETIARREMTMVSAAMIGQRKLMCLQTRVRLNMLDLRPHASSWPVLQSLRFKQTQSLAEDAVRAGFGGVIYRSAQQFGMDCYAIFGHALSDLKLNWSDRLIEPGSGNLHGVMLTVIQGSQIDLVP